MLRRRPLVAVLLLITCCILLFSESLTVNPDPAVSPKTAVYQAVTEDIAEFRDDKTRIIASLNKRLDPAPEAVSGLVQITIEGKCSILPGAEISFKSAVKPPRAYKNPGVFNYREFLLRNGISYTAFVPSCDSITVKTGSVGTISKLRNRLIGRLFNDDLSNGPILSAMLFGTRSIGSETADKVRDAGLSHLFAISGMQFAVMTAIVYACIGFLTGLYPPIYLHWPKQKISAFAALAFIIIYLTVALPQPSLTRAGLMIAVYLSAVLLNRNIDTLHALIISAIILLIYKPLQIYHISFQLSYLCILTLLLCVTPLSHHLENLRFWRRLPRPIKFVFVMSVATWTLSLVLTPLIALDFGTVNFSGLIHNLWAIPCFDFVLVPLSLMYFISGILSPALAEYPLKIWDNAAGIFLTLLNKIPDSSPLNFEIIPPHTEHVVIFYAGLFFTAVFRKKSVALASLIILLISLGNTYYQKRFGHDLEITQIDVGQGDAILVKSRRKTLLIDAGGHRHFDIGAHVVKPFLRHEWISKIDAAVITHPDTDHYLGFSALIDAFDIREIWIGPAPITEPGYRELLDKARLSNIAIRTFDSYSALDWDTQTRIEFFPPDNTLRDDNDRSLVMKISTLDFSALFTGDLMRQGEKNLINRFGNKLDADLLKIGHHGSKTSTTPDFLRIVSPQFATIGVAENSHYGHPHFSVLQTLARFDTRIYRTDKNGAITLIVNGQSVKTSEYLKQ